MTKVVDNMTDEARAALRYATALVEDRISLEAPSNAAICRRYVEQLRDLLSALEAQQAQADRLRALVEKASQLRKYQLYNLCFDCDGEDCSHGANSCELLKLLSAMEAALHAEEPTR